MEKNKRNMGGISYICFSQYDKPHATDDEDVRERVAKWAGANGGTEHMFLRSVLAGP